MRGRSSVLIRHDAVGHCPLSLSTVAFVERHHDRAGFHHSMVKECAGSLVARVGCSTTRSSSSDGASQTVWSVDMMCGAAAMLPPTTRRLASGGGGGGGADRQTFLLDGSLSFLICFWNL